MTTTPQTPAPLEDDPIKPWKAIAAFAAPGVYAFLQSILDDGKPYLPVWAQLVIGGLLAFFAVYFVRNPKRRKRTTTPPRRTTGRGAGGDAPGPR